MIALRVDNISKVFKLYEKPINRLKELLGRKNLHREFVALSEITFDLEKGGTLGLIGDNGAGKSTLLKILAKTLSPTHGQVEMQGVVSSLLELGTGFHPEMTGLENIFFYGSLLGMENSVMKKKVDKIIEFAELNEFINYPIKTYSSGMYVRLAFSVATELDPDILIIDEALSVGDQYFQRKCLEKMAEFRNKGKTLIFCSHDLYQIKTFCEKTVWLDHGKIAMLGDSGEVVNRYAAFEQMKSEAYKAEEHLLRQEHGAPSSFISIRDLVIRQNNALSLVITCNVKSLEPFYGHIGWAILREDHFQVSFMTTHMQNKEPISFDKLHYVTIHINNLNIVSGNYFIYVGIFDREAFKPIAVESTDFKIATGIDILNSLCYFDSSFLVE